MQEIAKPVVATQIFRPTFIPKVRKEEKEKNKNQSNDDETNHQDRKDKTKEKSRYEKDQDRSSDRYKEKGRGERDKKDKWNREKERDFDKKENRSDRTKENDRDPDQEFIRSRSRSKDKDRDKYVTSNTRATIPIKLKGEDKELQSIKIQYLGLNREKKKVLKPSEKFKNIFNFEWDSSEDTSYDANPLYAHRHEENLLFGRGLKAGIDIREQKKNSCNYETLIKKFEPKDEAMDQEKEKEEKEKDQDKEKQPFKEKEREKEKDQDKERQLYKEKERDKERDRVKEREKDRDKEKEKEKDRDKDKDRDREREKDKEKDREKDKDKERDKEKDRNKEKERDKERNKRNEKRKEKGKQSIDEKPQKDSDLKKKNKEMKEKEEEKIEIEKLNATEDKKLIQFKDRDLGRSKHWSEKLTDSMNERDWRIFREDNDIIIKGGRVPKPMRNWDEAILPAKIAESVRRIGYTVPTPIQMQAIPIGMECKDLIGIAPTGSGKSAAFLIPLIAYLQKLKPLDDESCKDGPYSLILTPTRELALQIDIEFQKFALNTKLRSAIVVGGRKSEDQAFNLRKGCEILIGTPGRIKDALQSKYTVLNQCNWVVLDEADKMIDLGFEEDVNYILDSIPQTNLKSEDETTAEFQARIAVTGEKIFRVTHLFSATMPPAVERIAKKYLRSFCYISIGEPGGGKKEIEQKVEMITENQKKHRLQNILDAGEPPIIIFVNQKKGVEVITGIVEKWGWKCVMYHGGKTQEQREAAVDGFKNRKYDILIATDLASRGLDVEGVKMVVNFDAPKNIQDFIHRTGRTGRAGKKGLAVTFLTSNNEDLFYDLKEFLVKNNQEVPQELAMHPAAKVKPGSIPDNVPRRKQILYIQ